ncbi:hypothetical protein BSKO_08461 [Bryopsis sp. KO-2023]|nr:hypothetical protein BSKO_08461 [Bryopsis sp. KO-2023]
MQALSAANVLTGAKLPFARRNSRGAGRRSTVQVRASEWQKVCTRKELDEGEGRFRAKVGDEKVFIQENDGELHCLSNVCTHLKLPLVGRTALLQGEVVDGCISCPAHKTLFDLKTGEVKGEWAPSFPDIPFVGKGDPKPLPVFEVKEEDGDIFVMV